MASKFIIFSLLTVAWAASLSKPEPEPQCFSRFDYEYKVMQKLVDLDNEQNKQKGDSATQLDRIKAIEAGLKSIKSTYREKLQVQKKIDREQNETANEMKTSLEEVKSQYEVMVSEIEKLKEKSAASREKLKTQENINREQAETANKLKTSLEEIESQYGVMESEIEKLKEKSAISREKLQTQENIDREQNESANEMKTSLEEVKSQYEVVVSEIETLKEKSVGIKGQAIAFSTALGTLTNIQSGQTIVFDHIILNVGGAYDVNSGKFTCPKSGVYLITFFIGTRDASGEGHDFAARLMVNSDAIIEAQVEGKHRWQDLQGGNAVAIKLNKGDQVWVKQYYGGTLNSVVGRTSSFSGVLLYPSD